MTDKQKRFIEEYLIDLNATQAAIRAGYSPDTAQQQSYELMTKPEIAKAVKSAMAERSRRTGYRKNWQRLLFLIYSMLLTILMLLFGRKPARTRWPQFSLCA